LDYCRLFLDFFVTALGTFIYMLVGHGAVVYICREGGFDSVTTLAALMVYNVVSMYALVRIMPVINVHKYRYLAILLGSER